MAEAHMRANVVAKVSVVAVSNIRLSIWNRNVTVHATIVLGSCVDGTTIPDWKYTTGCKTSK
jgi:hypothetical protein